MKGALLLLILFIFSPLNSMEVELHESKQEEHAKLALFQNGFTKEAIEKLCEINPEEITKIQQLHDKTGKRRMYQADLKNGDMVLAAYCENEGQRTTCTRLVQIPQETKFVVELPLKPSYYTMIEKQFAKQAH